MTQAQNYDIVGSFNNQRVSGIDAERSVNLFQYNDPLGKKPSTLLSTSGISDTEVTFPNSGGPFRGQFVFNGHMYVVIGDNVYAISSTLTATQINTLPLNTQTGYVGIDANNAVDPQVIFVDGENGYIWDTTTLVWAMITDPAFPVQPIDVCYLDGFFIVANGNTNQFQLSQLNNGLVWGPDGPTVAGNTFTLAAGSADITLTSGSSANYQVGTAVQFAGGSLPAELVAGTIYYVVAVVSSTIINVSATPGGTVITSAAGGSGTITNGGQLQQGAITTHPGNIVACKTLHRLLFLFSANYTEVWENAGIGTNLPFRRNNTLLMEFGTPAIASVKTGFDKMFFLSQDKDGLGSVMMVIGATAIPISNRALDYQLAQYVSDPTIGVADTTGVMIKENGLIFYRMNLTNANKTYVYDVSQSDPSQEQTKYWHEEEVLNGDRHPVQTHGYFFGKNYGGSYLTPILYEIDNSFFTNDGEAIRRMRIGRPLYTPPGYQRTRIDRFQLDLLQGTIDLISNATVEVTLDAESGFVLTTENDVDIILEQGASTGAIINPVVFLSISKDGGQSYGFMLQAPMGKLGERTFRTVWRKLGMIPRGQTFVPKIEFFNESPFIVFGGAWAMELEPE